MPRRAPSPRRARWTRSQTATRVAFGVIVVFVLAQAGWWIVFEIRSIGDTTRATLAAWQNDAAVANLALEQARVSATDGAFTGAPAAAGALRERLLERLPQIRYVGDASTGAFDVDPAATARLLGDRRRHVRMFAFEGPTFALVVLFLLLFIAGTLRGERELKRRQQNFLSAVTHEFKTPISTLRLLVQTARMRSLPADKQRDYLRRMEAELDRLERTSEQVLASARLEQAGPAPALAGADLNHVVQGIVGRLRGGLEARGALLRVVYSPEPLPVSIDADAFAVVLGNLLDNAVKYSPGSEKRVEVRLERRADVVEVSVSDRGIGLRPGEERRVFERFYRTGDELTRESEGVGLGLHLVRSVTEAMNGWVRAGPNPEAETGSRFTVVLPRRVGGGASDVAAGTAPAAGSAS